MSSATTTRLLVLGVVRLLQPVHGYDVRRELLSWEADSWANIAPGSIYNQLKTLTRESLLQVVGTEAHGGRPERTVYRVTVDGEAAHTRMLRELWWNLSDAQGGLMAAVGFMPFMQRDELIAALEHRIVLLLSAQASLEFEIKDIPNPSMPEHVAEVMRLAVAYRGGELEWCRALLARLKRGDLVVGSEFEHAVAQMRREHEAQRSEAHRDEAQRNA